MIVHYMCTYYSQWAHVNLAPRSQDQWNAFKFCRAVKNRNINGSLSVPLSSGAETLTNANVGRARAIFGQFIAHVIQASGLPNPVLVPIPSKDGLLTSATFRSLGMLQEALGPTSQYRIAPVLRFNTVLQPASQGGIRGRLALAPYLELCGPIPPGNLILVDDLLTTGGSLLATFDVLRTAGRHPALAIVCGLTVTDSLTASFGLHQKNIEVDPLPL